MADDELSEEEWELIRRQRAKGNGRRRVVRVQEYELDDDEWGRFARRYGFGPDDDLEEEEPAGGERPARRAEGEGRKVRRGYFG